MSATTARALPLGDFTTDRRVGWLAVLAFGLGLRGDRRWLAAWAAVASLAIATHYFAVS